ncbi:hypothetical protein V1478_012143 [Vespula squamosa]|uniref:Uncharacterized protein n=1 Tax=Vespula squamosa TaxID=30214 RepID=A0ABD2AD46_VESSQ
MRDPYTWRSSYTIVRSSRRCVPSPTISSQPTNQPVSPSDIILVKPLVARLSSISNSHKVRSSKKVEVP